LARKLIVEIVGDASSFEKALHSANNGAKAFTREMETAGRGAVAGSGLFKGFGRSLAYASGTFLGGVGLIAGIKGAISAASDLHEAITKTDTVFGKSSKSIEDWSHTTVKSMGLAREEALSMASSFGALFQPVGIVGKQAAQQSEQLVKLGSDLASFYNTDVQDALDAIQSGIVGQARPLRRYGVMLSEARVQQEALTETGKKHAKQLTDQEKILARIQIIYHDTALAQGDFARTSGGLANQERILHANIANLREELGTALLPIVTKYITKLNDWLSNSQNTQKVTQTFTTVVQQLGDAAQKAANLIGTIVDKLGGWKQALADVVGLWAGFKAAGIGAATAVKLANIAAAAGTEAAWKAALVSTGWGVFAVAAGIAAAYVVTHWEKVKSWFQTFWLWMQETADKAILAIVEPFTHIPQLFDKIGVHLGSQARTIKTQLQADIQDLEKLATGAAQAQDQLSRQKPQAPTFPTEPAAADPGKLVPPTIAKTGAGGLSAKARKRLLDLTRQWFDTRVDRMISRSQYSNLQVQFDVLGQVQALIEKRIARTKDITRRLDLEDKLLEVHNQQKQIRDQQLANWTASLQLQVDKAAATYNLNDDIAWLQKVLASIQARMTVEGKTLDLRQQEFQIQQQLKTVRENQMQQVVDALQFNVDKAGATARMDDDLAALRRLEAKLVERIKLEGSTLDRVKELYGVRQQIIAAAKEQRQQNQYLALGLDREGNDLVPTAKALRNRLGKIEDAVAGTFLDTNKTQALFVRIGKVLTGNFGKLTKDVRAKIKELLDGIDQQLSQSTAKRKLDPNQPTLQIFDPKLMTASMADFAKTYGYRLSFRPGGADVTDRGLPAQSSVTINGGLHLHGVQNVQQLEEELVKRAKQRPHARRGH
jgi:hypothetical protein